MPPSNAATWTIKGWSDGRPLALNILPTATGSDASAPKSVHRLGWQANKASSAYHICGSSYGIRSKFHPVGELVSGNNHAQGDRGSGHSERGNAEDARSFQSGSSHLLNGSAGDVKVAHLATLLGVQLAVQVQMGARQGQH